MQIARKRNPSCEVQPVKTKVSSACRSRLELPGESNWRILPASESRAKSEHPPSIRQENSKKISGMFGSSCVAECLVTSLVSRGMPFAGQLACKSDAKMDAKIHLHRFPGHPKLNQNRSRNPLGTPRGAQERPESVSGASRARPRASPARPGTAQKAPKDAPGHQKERPGAPGSTPWRPKSTPSRVRERKNRVFFAWRVREPFSERFFDDGGQFWI